MVDLFKQIILSGDINRHIRQSDGSSMLVYMPFAKADALQAKLERLEARVRNAVEQLELQRTSITPSLLVIREVCYELRNALSNESDRDFNN